VTRHSFEAMGCEIVVGGAGAAELPAIEELVRRADATFSRFRPDSELSRVNTAAGRPVRVSAVFARALREALRAAWATDGLVDSTLGAALTAAGYDRDFAALRDDPRPPGPAEPGVWRSVRLDGYLLRVPAGVALDLNGVVKALVVDDALALLSGPGFVSAGGDLAARGPLDVALPGGGAVRLVAGGLATSGSARRTWLRGGERQHHLLDARSGRPAVSPWEQVTVCGAGCLAADVAAKAAFLLGAEGPAWLDARGLPGRFVAAGGGVLENAAWRLSSARAA